jgi:glyoxylase-like metal-dependent hydrolase (beta-lactamase superfamily II)
MKFGDYECSSVDLGDFVLDGGAMFGVVPKTLWEKKIPADSGNLIPMKARSLLIRGNGRNILVDTGPGGKLSDKMKKIYGINQNSTDINSILSKYGLTSNDITDVIITHLHFDHTGGSTELKSGRILPAFPEARYFIQKEQFEAAINPGPGDTSSYTKDDFLPLEKSGVLTILDGPDTLFPGIELIITHGHTPAQQHPLVKGKEASLFFCADLVPTSAHIPLAWHMAYDNYPLTIMKEKEALLGKAAKENWILLFEHDPFIAAATLIYDKKNIVLDSTISI